MTSINTILTGWAVTFGALATAAVAFPAIAKKAEAQRSDAIWESRAIALTQIEAKDRNSDYAERLTDIILHTGLEALSDKDALLTSDVSGKTFKTYRVSKSVMQEHRCLSEAV